MDPQIQPKHSPSPMPINAPQEQEAPMFVRYQESSPLNVSLSVKTSPEEGSEHIEHKRSITQKLNDQWRSLADIDKTRTGLWGSLAALETLLCLTSPLGSSTFLFHGVLALVDSVMTYSSFNGFFSKPSS